MTSSEDILALAERVERATGPSKTLDIAIADALGFKTLNAMGKAVYLHASPRGAFSPLRYTASLDAAMTLAPRGAAALSLQQGMDACLTATHHRADEFVKRLPAFVAAASLRATAIRKADNHG